MTINNWNAAQVVRAETTWGHKVPNYSKDLFDFAIASGKSFLDLGCGFGRFLEYLIENHPNDEFEYIGYDSSPDMIKRISERFPAYASRCFVRDITQPISHHPEVVISSAVLIHLTIKDQMKILANLAALRPEPIAIGFDINSPDPVELHNREHFEKVIPPGFRMTWQSPDTFGKRLNKTLPNYDFTSKSYDVRRGRYKFMFFLKKKEKNVEA